MQCPNCHFENMPGNPACGRCGASLQLQAAAIAVHPPRAGAWQKRWRQWFPWRKRMYTVQEFARHAVPRSAREAVIGGLDLRHLTLGLACRMLVPGWAQLHLGHRRRGFALLAIWATLLLTSIVCFGTVLSGWSFGFAVAVHAISISDLFIYTDDFDIRRRMEVSVLALVIVTAGYWAVVRQVTHLIAVRTMVRAVGPFAAGDVVLYRPVAGNRSSLRPGDLVFYDLPQLMVGNILYTGESVDRIAAVGPCRVRWEEGQLWVDGQLTPFAPLNRTGMPDRVELAVPGDMVCVFPTSIAPPVHELTAENWRALSLMPLSNVRGRVLMRNYPITRIEWIQ
jgi:hypothetical protein